MNRSDLRIVVAAYLLVVIASGCTKTLYPSRWQSAPVTADGVSSEWPVPLQYYDSDTKLNYAVSNDTKNLYLCVRVGDDQAQMTLMRSGLTVWLDTEGKKNKTTGITYPLSRALTTKQSQINNEEKERPTMGQMKKQFLSKQNQVLLIGFKNANGLSPLQNSEGISVALNWDSSGVMIYEAVIPIKTFFKDAVSPSDTVDVWSVGFEIRPAQRPEGAGGGGRRRGGMGPRVGIGMGGGMGGVGIGTRVPMGGGGGPGGGFSEPKEVWTKFRLAFKQQN